MSGTVSKWLLAFGALAAASCGGATSSDTAGTGASGGSSATGGSSAGGVGGTSGGGSGGQAGMPARCLLPAEPGNCNAYFPAYFHNSRTGICEPFVYGGCGGNDNRFDTLAECQTACRGGSPDMDACQTSYECTLVSAGCCGTCPDSGEARGFMALNLKHLSAFERTRSCTGIACGPCPPVDELSSNVQYFASTCEAGQCTVIDIRESPLTECSQSSDCRLRDGVSCCEDCDGQGLVSIRPSILQDMLCGGPSACRGCASNIPPNFAAECQGGRCIVAATGPT